MLFVAGAVPFDGKLFGARSIRHEGKWARLRATRVEQILARPWIDRRGRRRRFGRRTARRRAARILVGIASLALLHGYGVVPSEKRDIQKVAAGRGVDEGFASAIAFLGGVTDEIYGVVRVFDGDV
jgi:hypothetical protein